MTDNKRCTSALLAALETIQEECSGSKITVKPVSGEIVMLLGEDVIREIEEITGHKLGNPLTPGTEEFEKAVEACVERSVWADRLARKFLGEDAPEEAIRAMKRKLCESLLV